MTASDRNDDLSWQYSNNRMRPTHYTEAEGGEWITWTERPITPAELYRKKVAINHPHPQNIFIEGLAVHALHFPDDTIWDSMNGWR